MHSYFLKTLHLYFPILLHCYFPVTQFKEDGTISYLYTTYPSDCLNSPRKDHFFSVLESLKDIDIDGIFLDGPVIANGGCYCDNCKALFKTMYDGKPGTDSEKRWEFNAFTKDNFLQEVFDRFKKDSPSKIVYMNFPITYPSRQYVKIENALKYNDILGTEGGFMFHGPAKNAYLWRTSFTSKLLEAVSQDKPRVIFMAADHKSWSWWMHSPIETALCIQSVTAAWDLFSPAMFEEINRNYIDHKGIPSRRLSYTVYNLENDSGFREFAEGRVKQLSVPGNGRKIITDDLPRTGVGLSRMGANKAIALGAYCLCLATIRLIKLGNMLSG